jgi:hypothetical protein
MPKHTKQTALFTAVSGKTLEVDFDGGEVTSDAGLLFLREVEKQTGVVRRIAAALHDPRHPSYVQHALQSLVMQRVFQILAGYEDGNDCTDLRHDAMMKMACDKRPLSDAPLASQPTISRFENTPSPRELYRMSQALVDAFVDSYDTPPAGIILDIDDTDDPTYGSQQLTFFNHFHNGYCYMPIHVYEGTSGKLIASILRPGKRPSGKEIVAIVKRIVKRIRAAWPDVGIVLRGDSHYSAPEVHDWCEATTVKFVLGQSTNKTLSAKASGIMAKAAELYALREKPVTLFSEFPYQAGSWSQSRRVIVKAEYNHQGANTRFIVTNLHHSGRRFIYRDIYCGRGAMELYIKAHKNHLCSDRTSCHSFAANQLRLFLHSIAYVLLHTFRQRHLAGTDLAHAQFDTIRLKLLKVGGRVRELLTKVIMHLPSSYPLKTEFLTIWRSCCTSGYT